jgi:hypothetical protein
MATNKQQIGGLPLPQVDPAQVQGAEQAMTGQAAQAGAPALNTFAQVQQNRAGRMASIATALGQQVGSKDPNVLAIQSAADTLVQLKTQIADQTTRLKNWPKPRPNEWLVFGTVTDAKGSPASGMTVRVFDRDRKYDDLLGDTSTDEFGDFSVIYHERDFKETGENLPDLYVMVTDTNGKLLYSSRDRVRYEAGRSEYFAIQLGAKKPRAARKKDTDDTAAPRKRKK